MIRMCQKRRKHMPSRGLDPRVHVLMSSVKKTWMAGTSPAKGVKNRLGYALGGIWQPGVESEIATSSSFMSAATSANSGVLR